METETIQIALKPEKNSCSHKFKKLGISEHVLKAIEEEKFETPSEIQEKSIPHVLEGKDVIARASTGSGKTLAFGSVIFQDVKKDFGIQALILTPTRELAEQNYKALNKFSKHKPLNIIPVYGGVSLNPQIEDMESAEVVVGTPGRILDHLARHTIDLFHLKILVLDEADRMLDMGFRDDVEKIIHQCPKKRQTLLFSATMSEDIVRLAQKYMNNPVEVSAEQYVDPAKLTQIYFDVEDNLKFSLLNHLLTKEDAKLVMVFCNTRRNVDFVANNLKANNLDVLPIHGGFSQDKRNKIMDRFHSQTAKILVCTDVAARGLDIKGVSHVYNYDIPADPKEYVHRIGRTARAGEEGKVINIVTSRDYENFSNIVDKGEIQIKNEQTPLIERARLGWMPERRGGRFSRGAGNSRFGRDRGSRGGFGGRGRSSSSHYSSSGRPSRTGSFNNPRSRDRDTGGSRGESREKSWGGNRNRDRSRNRSHGHSGGRSFGRNRRY
ncbi:DEAD/DEAH box helicase [Candidatus Pacearchaeota archaeon]|nr:DEAD/DEAH box helicase [Candidatus Pacearchaeota archaeon]